MLGEFQPEPCVEIPEGRECLSSGGIVIRTLIVRTPVAQSVIDEIDIAVVLLLRDAVPNVRRVDEVALRIAEKFGNSIQARDDLPVAVRLGRVLERIRREERVAE